MLIAFDIGNSTISIGVFAGKKLEHHLKLPTIKASGATYYQQTLKEAFSKHHIKITALPKVIISCVVPEISKTIVKASRELFAVDPLFVDHALDSGITYCNDLPANLGADRICDMTAAHALYNSPSIVVNLGTATVFNVLSKKAEYIGGAITSGVGISFGALINAASMLNKIPLEKPENVIGKNTKTSIQSGIIIGHASMVDGMIEKIKKETSFSIPTVIATGGYVKLIFPHCKTITNVNEYLTLQGLQILWERNFKN